MWRSRHHVLGRKRKRVEALIRQGWRVWGLIAGFLLAVWGTAAWFAISQERKAAASDHLPEIVLQAGENFLYDLAQLQPGQTRFFTYPINSSERSKLLVNRDSEGVVRAAFASCTTCYSFRKQHHLKEGNLICGQCQSAMRIGDRNERVTKERSCVAVPVAFAIENNKVIVKASAVIEGAKTIGAAAEAASDGLKPVAPRP
jgi:uncharacterized membrane protein